MAEEKKTEKRSKPKFLRTDWHKKIRLGRGVKKNQKWHGAKGRQNKIRLNRKGRFKPRVGWGSPTEIKDMIFGIKPFRVENLNDLSNVPKGHGVVIASVGKRKREEILKKAAEMKLKVLNKYKEKKE